MDVPPGYRLCSTADNYSSLLWFYIPLDKNVRCEDLPDPMERDQMPDVVIIGPNPDVPMLYETTDDVVRDERFFCHGKSYDRIPRQISSAPTAIRRAGKFLAGLETVLCTREDRERDRYSRAYLAYRPSPNDTGHEYLIAADVHLKNKRKANVLLDQIVKAFKLLK